jgi:membrane fusion protein, multidrug efflux system
MLRLMLCLALTSAAVPAFAQDAPAIRGVVRAVNEAAISSEIVSRIVALPHREGEAFKKGDVLVEFDCDRLKSEMKAADAELRGSRAAWENAARLYQMRAAGGHEVAMAAATHDKSLALLEGLQVRVAHCTIVAPFDGRVLDLNTRRYETPQAGQPLIRIIDDSQLEVDMLLPASALASAKQNAEFFLQIDDLGVSVKGKLARVGGALDIVSQTFKASGVINNRPQGIIPGMSGVVTFKPGAS